MTEKDVLEFLEKIQELGDKVGWTSMVVDNSHVGLCQGIIVGTDEYVGNILENLPSVDLQHINDDDNGTLH